MVRKFTDRKQQIPPHRGKATIPDRDIGHEASIHPDIDEAYPERGELFLLNLDEDGMAELATMVSNQLIIEQRKIWYEEHKQGMAHDHNIYTSEDKQTAYFEVLQRNKMNLIGNIIYHEVDPETGEPLIELPLVPVYQITINEASSLSYPVPDPLPTGLNGKSPYLVIHILKPLKGDKGDKGEQGEPGADGADGADGNDGADGAPGSDGADGAPGECDCQPPPLTDPETGQPKPVPPGGGSGGGYGSGPGGEPNPDGLDKAVGISCLSIGLDHGPHGTGVEYLNVDITNAISDAAEDSGQFDPATETLVSAKLYQEAVCYTGVLGSVTLPFFNIPLTKMAREATINDSKSNTRNKLGHVDTTANGTIVVEPPEGYNIGDVGADVTAGGRVYKNSFSLDLTGSVPIVYDGQFPALPGWLDWLFSATMKTGPKTAAYHRMELCGFTKRPKPAKCITPNFQALFSKTNYLANLWPTWLNIHHIDGWEGDEYPINWDSDPVTIFGAFSPTAVGNAQDHLQIAIAAGRELNVQLMSEDFSITYGSFVLPAYAGDYVYHPYTGTDFTMYPNQCYNIRFTPTQGNVRWTIYDGGVKWV